jgi:hypothetical protein
MIAWVLAASLAASDAPELLSEKEVAEQSEALNVKIRAIDVNFPRWSGGLMGVGALLMFIGLELAVLAAPVGGTLMLVGLLIAVAAGVPGFYTMVSARADREELIKQRSELERFRPAPAPNDMQLRFERGEASLLLARF